MRSKDFAAHELVREFSRFLRNEHVSFCLSKTLLCLWASVSPHPARSYSPWPKRLDGENKTSFFYKLTTDFGCIGGRNVAGYLLLDCGNLSVLLKCNRHVQTVEPSLQPGTWLYYVMLVSLEVQRKYQMGVIQPLADV